MIEVLNVSKVFNAGKSNEFVAVDDVSVFIEKLKITVLKGPSGSGKTTLLGMLGCMARPSSGRILLDGAEITSLPERFLTHIRRAKFGFVFQQFNLVKGITAIENVILPAYPLGESHGKLRERALHLLEQFKLVQKAESKVEWLSGGEAQRICIARALMNAPEIIIADEPTAHLDSRLSREFMDIVESLKGQGMTVIIASHDAVVHDSGIVDRTIQMRDGRIISESAPR
jgi:putative ABC transport system ATP-binding protein